MESIKLLLQRLEDEQAFGRSSNDPMMQFELDGIGELKFSSLLPERTVPQNSYREWGVRFRTMIADDSTRYSPPVKRNAALVSSVQVELGESDIGASMNQQEYELFINTMNRNDTQQAVNQLLRFFENSISKPLSLLRERHRVDAICDGYVVRRGANGLEETVRYPNISGHRLTVPSGTASAKTGWYDPNHDILGTLKTLKRTLQKKGYQISRIITTDEIVNECLIPNKAVQQYGIVKASAPGGNEGFELRTRTEAQALINAFLAYSLPQPETYGVGYSTEDQGWRPYMKERFIIVARTGRAEEVNMGEELPLTIADTLGYYGIGTTTGQLSPGVATKVESFDGKDARIEAEGWQTSFSVLLDPEAIVVLTIPEPV